MSNAGAKAPVDEDVAVGPGRLLNSILIWAVMSFSMLYFSNAALAISTASCCISSLMSTFLITALAGPPDPPPTLGSDDVGASTFSDMMVVRWFLVVVVVVVWWFEYEMLRRESRNI